MSDETNEILLRIELLLRALLTASVSQKLAEIRADKTLHQIYDMTGVTAVADIGKKVGVSTGKISGLWQSWVDAGLLVKVGKSYKKLTE